MKKMLATLLTGAMIVSAGSVMVQAEEVDKSQSIVIYTNNGSEGRDEWSGRRRLQCASCKSGGICSDRAYDC